MSCCEDILPLAEELGMPFALEDLKQYEKDMKLSKDNGELSDTELQAVVGGEAPNIMICFLSGINTYGHFFNSICFVFGFYV